MIQEFLDCRLSDMLIGGMYITPTSHIQCHMAPCQYLLAFGVMHNLVIIGSNIANVLVDTHSMCVPFHSEWNQKLRQCKFRRWCLSCGFSSWTLSWMVWFQGGVRIDCRHEKIILQCRLTSWSKDNTSWYSTWPTLGLTFIYIYIYYSFVNMTASEEKVPLWQLEASYVCLYTCWSPSVDE